MHKDHSLCVEPYNEMIVFALREVGISSSALIQVVKGVVSQWHFSLSVFREILSSLPERNFLSGHYMFIPLQHG